MTEDEDTGAETPGESGGGVEVDIDRLFTETEAYRPPRATLGPEPVDVDAEGNIDLRLALSGKTDYANGQRLISRYGHNIGVVQGLGWLVWDGDRWLHDTSSGAVRRMAHRTADDIRHEAEALRKDDRGKPIVADHFKWRLQSQNSARIEAMLREAKPYVERAVDDLDALDFVFNADGVSIDLGGVPEDADAQMYAVRKPRRDDLITMKAGVAYDPDAECRTWRNFLNSSLPDKGVQNFLQRWCGYLLTGSGEEQSLVICIGRGANGKSTLLDALSYVMGDYAAGLPFASLLHDDRKRGSEASPDIARLRGTRLVVATEPDSGARFSESVIKQLTGQDQVQARALREDFFEFRPTFKLMLAANNRPEIRGQDEGIWRRLLIVPFDNVVPKENRDKRLMDKLRAEAAGILNWMIDGYCLWRESGLQVPEAVMAATNAYREESDPIGEFLKSETNELPVMSVKATDLYKGYQRWCEENSQRVWSQTAFGKAISERGFARVKAGVVFYRGLELNRPLDDADGSDGSDGSAGGGEAAPPAPPDGTEERPG